MSESNILVKLRSRVEKLEQDFQKDDQENAYLQEKVEILQSRIHELRHMLKYSSGKIN